MVHAYNSQILATNGSMVQRVHMSLKARAKRRADNAAHTRLLKMSNRDLADMGITRDDVREAIMRNTSRRLNG